MPGFRHLPWVWRLLQDAPCRRDVAGDAIGPSRLAEREAVGEDQRLRLGQRPAPIRFDEQHGRRRGRGPRTDRCGRRDGDGDAVGSGVGEGPRVGGARAGLRRRRRDRYDRGRGRCGCRLDRWRDCRPAARPRREARAPAQRRRGAGSESTCEDLRGKVSWRWRSVATRSRAAASARSGASTGPSPRYCPSTKSRSWSCRSVIGRTLPPRRRPRVGLQDRAHRTVGVVEAGSDGARGDPEGRGDLRWLEADVVMEHEHRALVGRQAAEAALELVAVDDRRDGIGAVCGVGGQDADVGRHPGVDAGTPRSTRGPGAA